MVVPRTAKSTVRFVDEYCESYRDLFVEARSFEAFKHLHLGMISEAKRKSLPAITKVIGLPNAQSLQQFLVKSPWHADDLRQRRIEFILSVLGRRKLVLVIDETGDRKKGQATDYVKRQYIGNLGKVENGIVPVDAYGVIDNITFPLTFAIYKLKDRLKAGDCHRTKPVIAAAMVQELCQLGFQFELVLADSAYGESGSSFVRTLCQLGLPYCPPAKERPPSLAALVARCVSWPMRAQPAMADRLASPDGSANQVSIALKLFSIAAV